MACSNHPSRAEVERIVGMMTQSLLGAMQPYIASSNLSEAAQLGKFAEFPALMKTPGAVDLNSHSHNFEIFDNTSKSHICSVKTHSEGTQSSIASRYCEDFRTAIGTQEREKFDRAAEKLFKAKSLLPVPAEVQRSRSVEEVKGYLAQQSIMLVPEEHVEPVRDALRSSVQRHPEKYNLTYDEAHESSIVEALVSRVKGI